jgi:hypothetical protein
MLEIILPPEVQWTAIDQAHAIDKTIGRNGRPIGLLEMHKRKARGIKPGICDYAFWYDRLGFAIELKRSADEPLSDDQKAWMLGLIRARIPCKVCWTKVQVAETLQEWGLTRPFRVMA